MTDVSTFPLSVLEVVTVIDASSVLSAIDDPPSEERTFMPVNRSRVFTPPSSGSRIVMAVEPS